MSHKIKILRERERVKRWFLASCNKSSKSFTLVELLIVIGILAALASTVVVVINPTEMLRQGRDSTRMRELGSIHRALEMLQVDRPTVSIGAINTIYVSVPDTSDTCINLGLPTLPPGWTYACRPTASHRNIDGTGWIPVNFTTMSQGSPLSHLPIDPTNTAVSSNFYVYVTDGRTWVLASLIESERHIPSALRDGGTDFARFEAGNNLALWTNASGLVGYWSFDEGTGITARDLSGLGNAGTLINNPTWTTGRVGGALSFDGVDDHISLGAPPILRIARPTIEAWFNTSSNQTNMTIYGWRTHGFWLEMSPDTANIGRIRFTFYDSTPTRHFIISTRTYNNGNWNHAVGVYDGQNIRLYINGEPVTPVPRTAVIEYGIGSAAIGRAGAANCCFFNGLIDEVRIYNRALTEAEVMANFNATR